MTFNNFPSSFLQLISSMLNLTAYFFFLVICLHQVLPKHSLNNSFCTRSSVTIISTNGTVKSAKVVFIELGC